LTGGGTLTSDFSDTFELSGLIPTDTNGNPVIGATFTSASGTVYTVNGVVPEPSSTGIIASAIIGMLALRRRGQAIST